MMDRDEFTDGLESDYARKVFFGDITIDDVPVDKRQTVKGILKSNDLTYLYE